MTLLHNSLNGGGGDKKDFFLFFFFLSNAFVTNCRFQDYHMILITYFLIISQKVGKCLRSVSPRCYL